MLWINGRASLYAIAETRYRGRQHLARKISSQPAGSSASAPGIRAQNFRDLLFWRCIRPGINEAAVKEICWTSTYCPACIACAQDALLHRRRLPSGRLHQHVEWIGHGRPVGANMAPQGHGDLSSGRGRSEPTAAEGVPSCRSLSLWRHDANATQASVSSGRSVRGRRHPEMWVGTGWFGVIFGLPCFLLRRSSHTVGFGAEHFCSHLEPQSKRQPWRRRTARGPRF